MSLDRKTFRRKTFGRHRLKESWLSDMSDKCLSTDIRETILQTFYCYAGCHWAECRGAMLNIHFERSIILCGNKLECCPLTNPQNNYAQHNNIAHYENNETQHIDTEKQHPAYKHFITILHIPTLGKKAPRIETLINTTLSIMAHIITIPPQ